MVLLLAVAESAMAEDFSLHNGLRFGMSKEEAYAIEEAAGVSFSQGDFGDYWTGTIAGQDNAKLSLMFDGYKEGQEGLYSEWLTFSDTDSYDVLNDALVNKYGDTPFSSETGGF